MVPLRAWVPVAAVVLTSACASTSGFTEQGFVSKDSSVKNSGYRIAYGPDEYRLLPQGWGLENYYVGNQGRPNDEKQTGIYRSTMDWVRLDGTTTRVEYLPDDLKFRHGNGSLMIVATVAVPHHLRNLRLSAVAEEWANSYSGMQFSFKRGTAQRSASKIIESKGREVGGRPAREVTLDVVDVDQLQLNPDAPRTRMRIVFVQASLFKSFVKPEIVSPAFLFVGYSSDERSFDKGVRDYEDLLSRVRFSTPEADEPPAD
jgi:hypothetical protein